jgi:adenylosuccinate synthase
MPSVVVVGAQWGDEGKGKVVDVLAERADLVVRFQGGNNAGHTLVVGGTKRVLHLVPSGVLHPRCACAIGPGVVVDPWELQLEIRSLRDAGLLIDPARLVVSERAPLILPYHRALDHLREQRLGVGRIGTTGRGIGPAYEDAVGRHAIRVGDLRRPSELPARVVRALYEKNALIAHLGGDPLDADAVTADLLAVAADLLPHLGDSVATTARALASGQNVLFEGAQGTLLDVLHGTYPFVTSSHTVAGAACTGAGVGPRHVERALGVVKAYCTRVGSGPFPTEAEPEADQALRDRGHEYGATTGRPRRCGWLDLVALRYAVQINGLTDLAITKLDVLSGFGPLRVATAYRLPDGTVTRDFPSHLDLDLAEPVYEELPGWAGDLSGATARADLPQGARSYLDRIEAECGVPIALVGLGAERSEMLSSGDLFGGS